MDDTELMNIAAFKLRESANRIVRLANEAQSKRVRGGLFAVSQQLIRQEQRVHELRNA